MIHTKTMKCKQLFVSVSVTNFKYFTYRTLFDSCENGEKQNCKLFS